MRLAIILAAAFLVAADKPDPVKEDLAKLQGTWECVYVEQDGKYFAASLVKKGNIFLTISEGSYTVTSSIKNAQGFIYLDPTKKPKTINGTDANRTIKLRGIYHVEGDTLWLCGGTQCPKGFTTKNNGAYMAMLKRVRR
jgi:uncharacterized protein (TIGR03067 family)